MVNPLFYVVVGCAFLAGLCIGILGTWIFEDCRSAREELRRRRVRVGRSTRILREEDVVPVSKRSD